MIEIFAIAIITSFIIHMFFLIIRSLKRNQGYNQTIYLSGGRHAGDHHGAESCQLLGDIDELGETFVNGRVAVTSSFSAIYIRLYQLYTGKCYDAYLENMLQIGRTPGNGDMAVLVLDDPMVSKKHCMLYRRGNQIMIQDLESTNHTFVNGCQIQGAVPITHGDQLSLGKSAYQFQCYYQR